MEREGSKRVEITALDDKHQITLDLVLEEWKVFATTVNLCQEDKQVHSKSEFPF